jgi:Tol biopolymer transport system component
MGCGSLTPVRDDPDSAGSVSPSDVAPTALAVAGDETASDELPADESEPDVHSSSLGDRLEISTISNEAILGEITFALAVTDDIQPVDSGNFFTHGITEVHAIFDYRGIPAGSNWERVWYLNDTEVARVSDEWTGAGTGVLNYVVDNSGRPLPAGDWVLELYLDGELQALGVFVIEDDVKAEDGERAEGNDVYLLAYTKCDGTHHNLYVADTNGHNEQLIATRGAGPSWTPDGKAIFFYGEEGVDRQVRDGREYVFDGISNGLVALLATPLPSSINQLNLLQNIEWKQATARWASVSPDGSMVAFDAKPGGDYRIYFLGTADNQQFRYEILGEQADWSPTGQKIAYRSGREGQTGIWISNRDDTGHVRITDNGSDSFPAWSPDGYTIAFSREVGGNVDIYTVNVDGSHLQRLTSVSGHDTLPAYTPDGDIIFRSARSGSWGIWKMGGDGSDQANIILDACVGRDWAFSKMDVLP